MAVLHAIECDCEECLMKWRSLGNSSYETGLSRDERYLLNKMTSERIQKMEEQIAGDNPPVTKPK